MTLTNEELKEIRDRCDVPKYVVHRVDALALLDEIERLKPYEMVALTSQNAAIEIAQELTVYKKALDIAAAQWSNFHYESSLAVQASKENELHRWTTLARMELEKER